METRENNTPFTIVKHKVLLELHVCFEEYVILDLCYHFKRFNLQQTPNPLCSLGVGEKVQDYINNLIERDYLVCQSGYLEVTEEVKCVFDFWTTKK